MATSWEKWETGETAQSWGYTIPARLAYLCDVIVNLVILPFAILSATIGALHALFAWDRSSSSYQETKKFVLERSNHFLLSLFGSVIAPSVSHRYRDANLAPYVLAVRITVISAGLIYYGLFR